MRELTSQQYLRLIERLALEQPKVHRPGIKDTLKNMLNNAEVVLISRAEYDALKIRNELLTKQQLLPNMMGRFF